MSALASITTEQISADPTLVRCTGKPDVERQRSIRSGCSTCGKRDGLYWAHIDGTHAGLNSNHCDKCGKTVSLVFVEGEPDSMTITRVHPHLPRTSGDGRGTWNHAPKPGSWPRPTNGAATSWRDISPDDFPPVVEPEPTPAPTVTSAPSLPDISTDEGRAKALLDILLKPSVTLDQVREMVKAANDDHVKTILEMVGEVISDKIAAIHLPTSVVIERPDREVKKLDNVHSILPKVLKAASRGKHVMMVGPMGTGKSTIAAQVAEALDVEFRFMAVGPQTSKSDILGYMTADGTYVPSLFRLAYEYGGVFLFDELDAAHPGVLTTINAALANGHMAFPDGMVTRHADTRIMAAANTYGRGPDRMYVGRQAIDAATLDRFVVVEVQVDEALETSLAYATGLDVTKADRILSYVRQLRRSAEAQKMAVGFSPRASVNACDLIDAGFTVAEVIDSCIRKGLSDQDWHKVSASVITPSF